MLFSCDNIHMHFGARPVLQGISLGVHASEVLGIVGPNGAGKTTLLEILSGRTKPTQGRVLFEGQDVTALPLHQRARRGLARTYQSPVVPEQLSVEQVLKAARQAFTPYLTSHHAQWACDQVGLTLNPAQMAGSLETLNRRKLLLACLLMRKPKVLLMDEPAAGLLGAEVDEIDSILRYLAQQMGVGIILVEHRLELMTAIAQRVVVLDGGELIAEDKPHRVFDHPRVRAAYFETAQEAA